MAKVRDLLRLKKGREVHRICREAPVSEAARALLANNVSSLAVYDGDRLVGIFTKNDITQCCAERPEKLVEATVSDYMETEIFTTTPEADLDEVISKMIHGGFHHAPVRSGETMVGMITASDIMAHEQNRLHRQEMELLRYIQGSY